MELTKEIDDSLYSRQRYMLGDQAMKKMASSAVLLLGCDILGVEVAKNLVLTGIGKLLVADSQTVSENDVKSNFYVNHSDFLAKKTRAKACASHLSELNPYVSVSVSDLDISLKVAVSGDIECNAAFLEKAKNLQCIIATQCGISLLKYLDKFCRSNDIKFVSSNVYGLFSSIFCDFGSDFEVLDASGETLVEMFLDDISKGNPGKVTCLENHIHGLEDGDCVRFTEVEGMIELNGKIKEVKVVSPYSFTIGDTSELLAYTGGGLMKQVRVKTSGSHGSLESQLVKPDFLFADFGKINNPNITHAAFIALSQFVNTEGFLPRLWNADDAEKVLQKFHDVTRNIEEVIPTDKTAERVVHLVSCVCRSVLPPLATAVGGIAAQEVLKSLTGKYTPLKQWLYLDASELLENEQMQMNEKSFTSDLAACLGEDVVKRLSELKLFMVGCGAIGCEMLKNLALLGVSTNNAKGKMVVTDNDVIEKSNLNRQFLFRSRHVGQFKSEVAASVVKEISPSMEIETLQYKVGPEKEQSVFNDAFFEAQDVVINALDNVQARRYMDSRCVTNQRPLLESGTMGPKGHVQVIVPFLTESYSNQQDPADVEYPFCTLKSFPSNIEHTIQWARDKFEVLFKQKPTTFNKFWEGCQAMASEDKSIPEAFSAYLSSGDNIRDATVSLKLIEDSPKTWIDCVANARVKFEKFFNHKAKNLLQAFPLDNKQQDGSLFWALPKRPPIPIVFDCKNSTHMLFIISAASLIAKIYLVETPGGDKEMEHSIDKGIMSTVVPDFVQSKKEIVTDETFTAPTNNDNFDYTDTDNTTLCEKLNILIGSNKTLNLKMFVEDFEKDDDANHHIDFIAAVSNLRATMYGIQNVDRLEVKRIAGRIIPAISTTTSAVAGFATIQFLQIVRQLLKNESAGKSWNVGNDPRVVDENLSKYRNSFLNLALPFVLFSEPAPAIKTCLREGITYTDWDRWEVHGYENFKLEDFIEHFKSKFNFDVSAVLHGTRMIFIPIIPGHVKRLNHLMKKLINSTERYVDLTITFENIADDSEDFPCPPVRYFFS